MNPLLTSLFATISVFCIALLWYWAINQKKPIDHTHDLTVISVQPLQPAEGVMMLYAQTVVLKKCRCGSHGSTILAGDWTLEQLLFETNEVETLERIHAR